MQLGYFIATAADEIVQHVKNAHLIERLRMILLSLEFRGNSIRLARLLNVNRSADTPPCFVVCNNIREVPLGPQSELESLGVDILERKDLDSETLMKLFQQHVLKD